MKKADILVSGSLIAVGSDVGSGMDAASLVPVDTSVPTPEARTIPKTKAFRRGADRDAYSGCMRVESGDVRDPNVVRVGRSLNSRWKDRAEGVEIVGFATRRRHGRQVGQLSLDEKSAKLYKRAEQLCEQGSYAEMIKVITAAVVLKPDHAFCFKMGMRMSDHGGHQRASLLKGYAIDAVEPNNKALPTYLREQAWDHLYLGNHAKAKKLVDRAIYVFEKAGIQSASSYRLKALVELELGNVVEARIMIEVAVSTLRDQGRKTSIYYCDQAFIELVAGNTRPALRAIERRLESVNFRQANYCYEFALKALAQMAAGDLAGSQQTRLEAIENGATPQIFQRNISEILEKMGSFV